MISRNRIRAGICAVILALWVPLSGAHAYDRKTSYSLSRFIMGGYYEQRGDIDGAIAEYRRALRTDSRNSFLHLCLASAYLKKNDLKKATEELNTASRLDPDAAEPHAVLALLLYTQNKTDEAGREYTLALEKASRLDPGNIGLYRNLAALYMERDELDSAERTYRLIIGLAPEDFESYFYLANICDEQGREAEAVVYLKKTLELSPDYHQALNYLGYMYADENVNLEEAGRLIGRALELDPGNGAYMDSLGWLLFRQGKFRESVAQLEKAAAALQDPVIYDHLGDASRAAGDTEKSLAAWKRSLELDPKQDSVREKLDPAQKAAGKK